MPYTTVTTVEGAKQTIAQGPVASQEAIKKLGTNGGGFFNANSAHPFENPTPLTNFVEMFLMLVIPAALTYTFGKMVGDTRQGWAIFAAFTVMFLVGVFVCYGFEQAGNPDSGEAGCSDAPPPPASRAATWKARKSASASSTRLCSPPSPPTPVAAPSTHARQLHCPSPAWFRCST